MKCGGKIKVFIRVILNQSDVKDSFYSAPVHMLRHKGEAFGPDDKDTDEEKDCDDKDKDCDDKDKDRNKDCDDKDNDCDDKDCDDKDCDDKDCDDKDYDDKDNDEEKDCERDGRSSKRELR